MRNLTKAIGLIFIATVGLAPIAPSPGQDRMILGPRQFESDKSAAGAVLCAWSLYVSVQARTAICVLPRQPIDDAIDQAVIAIDEFILTNSSLHPTKSMLEDFKQRAAASVRGARQARGPDFCKNSDLEGFRSPSPEKIQASVKSLLAVPREPVMNPCL